nr:ribonuclease H-like domain-containing protein [Tanacetum cinerariifolium]
MDKWRDLGQAIRAVHERQVAVGSRVDTAKNRSAAVGESLPTVGPNNMYKQKLGPHRRHVDFDETQSPYKSMTPSSPPSYQFLEPTPSSSLLHHILLDPTTTLSRDKACLVANGGSQQLGVDFDETFSSVVKPATIRTVLSLVVSHKWPIHQLDVKNAFLNGDLDLYMVCLYMHNSREPHFVARKRILRYVRGTVGFSLQLYALATTSLVGYIDVDWAGCPSTRRSTSGYCVFLGDNLLYWSFKCQHTLSRFSAEVEYRDVANVVAKTAWLRNLPRELHSPLSTATLIYCDNVSVFYMSVNPVQCQRTKHIKINIHFIRDMVTVGQVRVFHVHSRYQYADIFTKGLPSALIEEFRSSLSVYPSFALTAGAY